MTDHNPPPAPRLRPMPNPVEVQEAMISSFYDPKNIQRQIIMMQKLVLELSHEQFTPFK